MPKELVIVNAPLEDWVNLSWSTFIFRDTDGVDNFVIDLFSGAFLTSSLYSEL